MAIPKTPAGLGPCGAKFWKAVQSRYCLDTVDRREKLAVACRCLDDEAAAAAQIKIDGRYLEGRFGAKEHPAGKVLRDSRVIFLRALRELGLDVQGVVEDRPRGLHCRKRGDDDA